MIRRNLEDKRLVALFEALVSINSLKGFGELCSKHLPFVFGCERANLTMVDRFRKVFYKVEHDEEQEEDYVKSFPIEQCLASACVISGLSIHTDKVKEETRFTQKHDDPEGIEHIGTDLEARQIITCPIYTMEDKKNDDDLSKLPRAVV